MNTIELKTTYTHQSLGKLTIEVSVNTYGQFDIQTISLRWRKYRYGSCGIYIVHFRLLDDRWKRNYFERFWRNGRFAELTANFEDLDFIPALEEFANSDEMRQIADRLLKQWNKRISSARQQLKVAAQ